MCALPCPRSQPLRSATSPPSPLLRYRSIHRRCRGSNMASSSSKGGGGGSPANSSSSIYPASFIKRNLVPGADSYRQTLAALRDMDKVRCAGGLGGLVEVGLFEQRERERFIGGGKGGRAARRSDGPRLQKGHSSEACAGLTGWCTILIRGSDQRWPTDARMGLSFFANWCVGQTLPRHVATTSIPPTT